MKKHTILLLALCMLLSLAACSGKGDPTSKTTAKDPDQPPFQTYEYTEAGITIGVPWNLPAEPVKGDDRITFEDPEAEWTVSFVPLTHTNTSIQAGNLTRLVESFKDFGFYQNVELGEEDFDRYKASSFRFERNPDWDPATQGYSISYQESHAIYVVDYKEDIISGWGGLMINVAAPEKTAADLSVILADEDVRILLDNLKFNDPDPDQQVSFPGLTVSFPANWRANTNEKDSLYASMEGELKGTIYFNSSIYADPKEAAAYIDQDYRTLEYGGRSWYGAVHTVDFEGGQQNKTLKLYSELTDLHAMNVNMFINEWKSDDDFWAATETETFKNIMESVAAEPDQFHNPEDDYKDEAGFECNNINEISAYTGTDTDIEIPSVIGTNEIYGINYGVFQNNTSITSVVIPEGVTYIEGSAFKGCSNLKSVTLPDSLTMIDTGAFEDCSALESVTFGNCLVEIGGDAFENCENLKDVILPDSVSRIGSFAFAGAGAGSGRFTCPAEGTVYEHQALSNAKFDSVVIGTNADLSDYNIMEGFTGSSVTIGDGVTALGDYFLIDPYAADTQLKTVTLPGTVKSIGSHAFSGRLGMKEIYLESLETMGEGAFSQTGLVDIVIPGTLKEIPGDAFSLSPDVETITINEGVETIGSYAFSSLGIGEKTGTYNFLTDEEVEQHKDVVHVEDPAYTEFINVWIPSTIKHVENGAFSGTRLDGLYLEWLTSPDQLPDISDFTLGFDTYSCIYVTQEALDAQGDALNEYFAQDENFARKWMGKVRIFEERHQYWTDEELGIDA